MRRNRMSGLTKILYVPLIMALALVFSVVSAIGAAADSGSATYQYLVGTGFIAGTNPPIPLVGPDVAMASDGSTVTLTGRGTLSIHPKSVSGTGSFSMRDSAGNVTATGTWSALSLDSFVSYGNGTPQGIPIQNTGGEAVIQVQLSTGPTAVLTVTCLVGTPPAGKKEGVRLAVGGGPNFNKQVSGETLFILQ
jgi:hypothetical protein